MRFLGKLATGGSELGAAMNHSDAGESASGRPEEYVKYRCTKDYDHEVSKLQG